MKKTLALLFIVIHFQTAPAQLTTDHTYRPVIKAKTYPNDDGTVIHIDEGHNNHHIQGKDYQPLASMLKADGYRIQSNTEKFSEEVLQNIDILFIASPQPDSVTANFKRLPTPSAFTAEEVEAIKHWVYNGGSLFLVADHMPLAGASASLAKVFGFTVYNSFVMNSPSNGVIDFKTSDGTLLENSPITSRRNESERIEQIRTFTGHAFKIPEGATSILRLTKSQTVYLTKEMWNFKDLAGEFSAEGLSQGAIVTHGQGKVAFFGEAAMFKARLLGKKKIGMNHKKASENYQLLLNVIHWLDNQIE